jgi:hypothetical protein
VYAGCVKNNLRVQVFKINLYSPLRKKTMKQKITATTFLFILLCAGCIKTGDPIIGNWKMMNVVKESLEPIGMGGTNYIEFRSDGKFSQNFLGGGDWKRLDDNHLKISTDSLGPYIGGDTRTVTVKIEGDVLTMTESDGKTTKFKR